jgi:uncharacterized membrane protein YkvA (DUF1232 family)
VFKQLRLRAEGLKQDTYALYLAYCNPRVPWYAKAVAAATVAYAASPIDLIPDFIPVLGYLDDLVIVPLGIALAVKLVPVEIMEECRRNAQLELDGTSSMGRKAAAIVILIWVLALAWLAWILIITIGRR